MRLAVFGGLVAVGEAARRPVEDGVPELLPGGVVPGIRSLVSSLNPGDARVARVIVSDPGRVVHLSVGDVASEAQTSASTVVRCCQRLGFKGFQHLKIALAQELGTAGGPGTEPALEGSPGEVLRQVLTSSARALTDALATVDTDRFEETVSAISGARKVLFVGVGTSAPLAQDAAYRFLTIGVGAEAPPDVHTQHVAAKLLGEGDVCFAVSHTGATRETVTNVRDARASGARTIVLTSFSRSPIAEHADVVLVAGGPEMSFRMEAMTSRVAHLSVLDALFVAVASRDTERSNVALDAYADMLAEHRY